MNEQTRRGLLMGALVVLGASAGCQGPARDGDGNRSPVRTDGDGNDAPSDGTDESVDAIYLGESVSELPDAPENPAFGVTGTGIYQYDSGGEDWRHIQYGERGDPVERFSTAAPTVGTTPSGRPLISNGDRTVYVDPDQGDDDGAGTESDPLATIQEAVWRAPIYLRHQYTVDLASVPDTPVSYDEDVLVPTVIGTGQGGEEADAPEPGPFINLVLRGEQGDPSAVEIGSLMFGNVLGTSTANLYFATVTRDSPYDDERYALSAYGNGEVKLFDVKIADGPTNGLLAYGARMKASFVDFGRENVDIGLKAKRHASVVVHDTRGTLEKDAFRATGNSTISVLDKSKAEGTPQFNTLRGGLIYSGEHDTWVGTSGNTQVSREEAARASRTRSIGVHSTHPEDVTPGDVWYVDGSEDVTEGFYGQTADGAVRFG